ncbi:hypothetical protein G5V59_00620 [Nocardioides sp. W3-2-3]|uniref:CT398-like coiled coil hairpin domain-containing protein n=1 Tax=Nocardioides convexus TaxID=2712224 RepID=UPI0024187256|nr:hypothetical protein [Nocardioides convexus]NGZ99447.1 hypothetical protein [Nocardioides convexus]
MNADPAAQAPPARPPGPRLPGRPGSGTCGPTRRRPRRSRSLLGRRGDIDGRLRDQRIVVDDLTAAQAKADADVEQVKARRTRDRDRMDSGAIGDPKALERMQHESRLAGATDLHAGGRGAWR